MTQVTVLVFGPLRDRLGVREVAAQGATVSEVWDDLTRQFPSASVITGIRQGLDANAIAATDVSLLAHATMEPCNATVHLTPDRLDVWMGSQTALTNSLMAAELAGLKPEQVYFHQMYLGGGFGRRSNGDELRQAIRVVQAGKITQPLQLL